MLALRHVLSAAIALPWFPFLWLQLGCSVVFYTVGLVSFNVSTASLNSDFKIQNFYSVVTSAKHQSQILRE
jgi:hypothetical protein